MFITWTVCSGNKIVYSLNGFSEKRKQAECPDEEDENADKNDENSKSQDNKKERVLEERALRRLYRRKKLEIKIEWAKASFLPSDISIGHATCIIKEETPQERWRDLEDLISMRFDNHPEWLLEYDKELEKVKQNPKVSPTKKEGFPPDSYEGGSFEDYGEKGRKVARKLEF